MSEIGREGRGTGVLLFAQATAAAGSRSGIHRVAVELARALPGVARTELVRWNAPEGQLAFMDDDDHDALFGDDRPAGLAVRPEAHRVAFRFGDTLDASLDWWLVFPEIAYHLDRGNETFARILSQCRDYGVRVATIFYDLIPVTNPAYARYRAPHVDYAVEIARSDLILPISQHSGAVLRDFYADSFDDAALLPPLARRIRPVLLPEGRVCARPTADEAGRDTLLMVGTVEPRKRQLEVLEAIDALRRGDPAVARLRFEIVGSLHPDIVPRFCAAMQANPAATYHAYLPDSAIEALYERALFTVFASNDEGYGLPIAESLARGVPCLAANFGSMAEVAEGGGCLAVDVNDGRALRDGIARLAADATLRRALRQQIAARRFRGWDDYAGEVVAELARAGAEALPVPERVDAGRPGTLGRIILADPAPDDAPDRVTGAILSGGPAAVEALPPGDRTALYSAEAAGFESEATYYAALAACAADRFEGLFPTAVEIDPDPAALGRRVGQALAAAIERRRRWRRIAADETRYMALARRWRAEGEPREPVLSLVVSTYNRSRFVTANARWLARLIEPYHGRVDLTVVDNVSTDDSWASLQPLAGPRVRLVQNPSNTGMLGNLRVCSVLPRARHVWVTGDDDFIAPEALARVLEVIEAEPGLPLLFGNFGVYHRETLRDGDDPAALAREAQPLAREPGRSGIRTVAEIAAEHDNLFTAVYPIVFRSDILAACFNHPFDRTPFLDLVESVPTTRIILETYPWCPAWWMAEIAINGNAHNSWSRHRPRWHGLLMPIVLERAREAGVAADRLRAWADTHRSLLDDALQIARDADLPVHFDGPADLEPGTRVFREELRIPGDLRRWRAPAPEQGRPRS